MKPKRPVYTYDDPSMRPKLPKLPKLPEPGCSAPEGHDYYVALERPCDHCGAAR